MNMEETEKRTICALRWSELRRMLICAKKQGWKVLRIYTVREIQQPMFTAWETVEIKERTVRCADLKK